MLIKTSDCDFVFGPSGWRCEGDGNLLGERSFGHGATQQAAYDDYLRVRRAELADMIEDNADEAELAQSDMDPRRVGRPTPHRLHDHLTETADVDAMRSLSRRLRSATQGTEQ